ncbi:CopG family ribbon-helix-helix protein [Azospirillum argentinense]|uniref:CopG family ribbon-helix-helix protein n=1 Tax=Azospirillum argentinense TaxID=2970906 RepID=A0ABW8V7I7_9PROT
MSEPVSVTIRVDGKTAEALDRLARATAHDPAWHVERAVESYLADQCEAFEDIRRAVADADEGDFASDDEAENAFASFGQPLRAQ